MNQRTHSWIAIRAIALLEDEKEERNLVRLLKPHARKATVGAWIPDQIDAKRGGSSTENHVLKIEPYAGDHRGRFITRKKELLRRIGTFRKTAQLLQNDSSLDADWWAAPYKGDVRKRGQHLPNRAMALSTMMKDLLLMGNPRIDQLIPGRVRFAQYMDPKTRTEEEAVAMYFFMLSHFVADASMPCHCDGRYLAGYARGLHKELEAHWSRKVGTGFEKANLLQPDTVLTDAQARADASRVLERARDVGAKFNLDFKNSVPGLRPKHDVWLELVDLCRASFAVASIIAPPAQYPYHSKRKAPFKTVFSGANGQLLKEVNKAVLHDAVLNTAIVWKHVWNKVAAEES